MTLRALFIVLLAGLVAIAVPCWPSDARADKAADQAARQLEFAREELNAGRFERAIKSAESAMRLDPTLYEAIVIKALSFEAVGEVQKAEALLIAYLEFSRGFQPDPRVGEALNRLSSGDKRKKPPKARDEEVPPTIEEHMATTQTLIGQGRCDEALVPAKDFVKASPRDPRAHVALGDVHRCAVRLRQAGLAYRKAVDLGSREPALLAQIEDLEAKLATLVVKMRSATSAVPQVVVMLGDLAAAPTSFDRGVARFELMPTATPLEVRIDGRGFEPLALPVPALMASEIRRMEAALSFLGVGTVSVASWPRGIDRVEIMEGREAILVQPGEVVQLGVGRTVARVTNRSGAVEVPLVIARSREIVFEPGRWIPAALEVSGLPTGATVEVGLGEHSELTVIHAVPRGGGALDQQTGALIAPPQAIEGLVAGRTTLRVKHPSLGVGAQAVSLAPAQANEVTFDQAQLPGTADLVARWTAHGSKAGGGRVNVPALGSAIAGGVALALGGVFAGLSADSASQQRALYDSYVLTTGGGADAVGLFNQYQLQRRTTQDRATAAGIFGGIGVIGIGVAIPLGVLVKPKARTPAAGWEPEGF